MPMLSSSCSCGSAWREITGRWRRPGRRGVEERGPSSRAINHSIPARGQDYIPALGLVRTGKRFTMRRGISACPSATSCSDAFASQTARYSPSAQAMPWRCGGGGLHIPPVSSCWADTFWTDARSGSGGRNSGASGFQCPKLSGQRWEGCQAALYHHAAAVKRRREAGSLSQLSSSPAPSTTPTMRLIPEMEGGCSALLSLTWGTHGCCLFRDRCRRCTAVTPSDIPGPAIPLQRRAAISAKYH